jgi:hypothetical protein
MEKETIPNSLSVEYLREFRQKADKNMRAAVSERNERKLKEWGIINDNGTDNIYKLVNRDGAVFYYKRIETPDDPEELLNLIKLGDKAPEIMKLEEFAKNKNDENKLF